MSSLLQAHLAKRKQGAPSGIYSVCSAHHWIIRAAAEQAAEDRSLLLIEATSNQVNQFGGYTGMRPADFRQFVLEHVHAAGIAPEMLILGGDHLGPNPWRDQPAEKAMEHAVAMVRKYVEAGFTKIHLDASMSCADDPPVLANEVVAQRAARLCEAAESARPGAECVYVIGTEVPTPGGTTHSLEKGLQVTSVAAAAETLEVHRRIFAELGLPDVWPRILALVVQPGVEFSHESVVFYDHEKATPLCDWLRRADEAIVFEAHSTDYQVPDRYRQLVEDGFAILKVGPALTFAMREVLYALEDIEGQLVPAERCSHLSRVVDETMIRDSKDWKAYYHGTPDQQRLLRVYSYSDRVRYYWQKPEIEAAVERLLANLASIAIPETMLSRYLPAQYERVRGGRMAADAESIIVDRIRDVLRIYALACA
jgi:D-tagatose-1,6-bisphosphate aldolase subunit GatZ/KbaZ